MKKDEYACRSGLSWMPMHELRAGGFAFAHYTHILGIVKIGAEEGLLYKEINESKDGGSK